MTSVRNKRDRFVELAEKRVTRAIQTIRLIGNLGNRNNYEFSNEELERIIRALESEVRQLKRRFSEEQESKGAAFRL